jgi:DNA-binding XRE family transcriptional regulator
MTPFNLKAARINEGLTVAQFAEAVSVNERSYRRLENGRQINAVDAKKVADHFGIKVTDLPAFVELTAEAA